MSNTWTFADVVFQISVLNSTSGLLALITAVVASLPTTEPASSGVLWLNGQNVSIS